jgi:osmotically-inducible protein OsmY
VFRDDRIPKDTLSLNAENGVVHLRGEVPDSETMDELVERVRKVDGVKGVENLTHLPSEAAPTQSA